MSQPQECQPLLHDLLFALTRAIPSPRAANDDALEAKSVSLELLHRHRVDPPTVSPPRIQESRGVRGLRHDHPSSGALRFAVSLFSRRADSLSCFLRPCAIGHGRFLLDPRRLTGNLPHLRHDNYSHWSWLHLCLELIARFIMVAELPLCVPIL